MKTEMWDEFWIELAASDPSRHVTIGELFQMKERIKRRHLPEQVAEILRNVDGYKMNIEFIEDRGKDPKLGYSGWVSYIIAETLESGDTTKIEKWVKK